jgi:hypothetical protein
MKVGIVAVLLPAEPLIKSPLKHPDRLMFLPTSLFNRTEGSFSAAKPAESKFSLLASNADVKNESDYPKCLPGLRWDKFTVTDYYCYYLLTYYN